MSAERPSASLAPGSIRLPAEGSEGRTPAETVDEEAILAVAGLVRRVRRLADLSQRDLARRVGTSPATIARAERDSGARITLDVLARILALVGMRVLVVDQDGEQIPPTEVDAAHDNGGRHAPAHLDPYVAGPAGPPHFPLGFTTRRIPRICWHHRAKRDAVATCGAGGGRPRDHLADAEVDARWILLAEERERFRLAARARMEARARSAHPSAWDGTGGDGHRAGPVARAPVRLDDGGAGPAR